MRWDSPFVLAAAGTLAIHLIFVVALDAVVVIYPYRPAPPAPRIDLVDVEVPPPPEPPKPPPPPVAQPEEPKEIPKDIPKPRARTVPQQRVQQQEQPPQETPPEQTETTPGGSEVVQMDDIAPAAHGVAVKAGPRNTGKVGRGGSGGGTGAGSGAGAGETPPPVSVATIKKRAMPKGDYGYFNTDDYPAAAKQLGIEGAIRVRLIVDDKGKVKQAVLLNRLGHGLDELALARARKIEFEPALDTDDRPVTSVVVWTFHMTLPK